MSVNIPQGRNIIVAFDGTADTYDNDVTNIVRLVGLLDKASPDQQLVYYQPGIGTYVDPTFMFSPTMRKIAQVLDQGVAWYLDGHIMGGYQYLMDNYRPGDKIYLFGFSRGAYTARCLAGMLHKVGLLPKDNKEHVQFAYECYKNVTKEGIKRSQGFKNSFSIEVKIEFLGVWDTVASVGVFYSRHLPFTSSNTIVKTFRHALALDERRAKFQANTWHRDAKDKKATAKDPENGSAVKTDQPASSPFWNVIKTLSGKTLTVRSDKRNFSVDEWDEDHDHHGELPTDVKEVWFAGCHADVGGGSVRNDTKSCLAHPSLRWMINELLDTTTIKLNEHQVLVQLGIDCRAPSSERRCQELSTPPGSRLSTSQDRIFKSPAEAHAVAAQIPSVAVTNSESTKTTYLEPHAFTAEPKPHSAPTTAVSDSFPISPKTDITHVDDGEVSQKGSTSKHAHVHDRSTHTVLTVAEEQEFDDATAPSYDQLSKKPWWWILELIPMKSAYQDENDAWHTSFGWNRGRGRIIRYPAPMFHYSVKTRMDAGVVNAKGKKEPYAPKAQFSGPPIWVE